MFNPEDLAGKGAGESCWMVFLSILFHRITSSLELMKKHQGLGLADGKKGLPYQTLHIQLKSQSHHMLPSGAPISF